MENSGRLILNQLISHRNIKSQHTFDILEPALPQSHTRAEALNVVWFYMEKYWTLKDETPEYFLLKRTKATLTAHIIIAITIGWWLMFIPNLIYHLIMQEEKRVYK